jgi:hypothetical protein
MLQTRHQLMQYNPPKQAEKRVFATSMGPQEPFSAKIELQRQ